MIDWIAAAFTSTKTAGDIAKSLVTLRDEQLVRSKVMDLTNTLLDLQQQMMQAQQVQMALLKQNSDLEAELRKVQSKQDVLDRYQLREFGPGKVAYTLKDEFVGTDPAHLCCTNCYDKGRRSVLQAVRPDMSLSLKFTCPACGNVFYVKNDFLPVVWKAM